MAAYWAVMLVMVQSNFDRAASRWARSLSVLAALTTSRYRSSSKRYQVCVVYGAAVGSGDDAVLGRVQVQTGHVAGEHVLQKGQPVRPLHQQPTHVGHVEEAAGVACVQVLGYDAAGILDGHFPAPEVHHRGAGLHVDIVKLCAFEFAHNDPPYFCGSIRACARQEKWHKVPLWIPCASVLIPERFPGGWAVRLHLRRAESCAFRSIVMARFFCLRAFAFPFGAAHNRADSLGPLIRYQYSIVRQKTCLG